MSRVAPAALITWRRPVAPVHPVRAQSQGMTRAERNARKRAALRAFFVAARRTKEAGKGLVLDIRV